MLVLLLSKALQLIIFFIKAKTLTFFLASFFVIIKEKRKRLLLFPFLGLPLCPKYLSSDAILKSAVSIFNKITWGSNCSMDVKGLAWIGNIYDKFEAMCLEMEEVMYEDTVKFVENQVQTVGASVKKFYSEVMKDLHPESYVDPVKRATTDLSLNPYAHPEMTLKASAKNDDRETEWKLTDDSKVISGKSKTGLHRRPTASRKGISKANFLPPLSGSIAPFSENLRNVSSFSQMQRTCEDATGRLDVVLPSAGFEGGSRNANGKNCKAMVDTGLPMSHASVNSPMTKIMASVESTGQKQADSTSTSSSGGLSSESSGSCTNSGVVSQMEETVTSETGIRKSVEVVIMAHQERLDNCSTDAAKNDDIIDPEVEIIEPLNESILEETCVLVEEDKLHFVPQGKGSHKSYKKKLREAFSSKMRLTRKEYEQLAAKYTEQDSNQESAVRVMPDRLADSTTKLLPVHSSESEWELL